MAACSICNDPVLIAALKVALGSAPGPSGDVDSVVAGAGGPIVCTPTTGDVVVSLPIDGVWSATNNVLKSTSATALEWGTDSSGPAPVVATTSYGIQANIFFNAGPTFDINSATTSNTVLYSQQQICNLVATTALTPADGAVIGFLLDVAFPITNVTTIVIPAYVSVAGGTLVDAVLTVGNTVGPAPYQATFSIQTNNLNCSLGDTVYFLVPQFTLALGM